MRIFTGVVGTETNSFAPLPTRFEDFEPVERMDDGVRTFHPYGMIQRAVRERATEEGHEIFVGRGGFAMPGGVTTRAAYEELRANLLADLRAALPVDVICLGLHGAMIADGYEDAEGDLLAHVRALAGPRATVAAQFDLHGHLSPAKVAACDVVVSFREYPHTDIYETAVETVDLALRAARGQIRPVMATFDCALLSMFHTTREPMRSIVEAMGAARRGAILSVSFFHSFPWGDCAALGAKMLVLADGDAAAARRVAEDFGRRIVALRESFNADYLTPAAALDRAGAIAGGPVVLADSADNPGGGASGDATFLLREMLARRAGPAAFGPLWDPGALDICFAAGVGARLSLRIGGKVSRASGAPLDVDVRVKACLPEAWTLNPFGRGGRWPMGAAAVVEAGEGDGAVEIVLARERQQALGDIFTDLGVNWRGKKLVAVKSSQHFYAAYAPDAAAVLYVETPASMSMDWRTLEYRQRPHPLWPLDQSVGLPQAPLATDGPTR